MSEDAKSPKVLRKNQAAAEMGRRGGKKGGAARAAKMTSEERKAAARLAAQRRWTRPPVSLTDSLPEPDPAAGSMDTRFRLMP